MQKPTIGFFPVTFLLQEFLANLSTFMYLFPVLVHRIFLSKLLSTVKADTASLLDYFVVEPTWGSLAFPFLEVLAGLVCCVFLVLVCPKIFFT